MDFFFFGGAGQRRKHAPGGACPLRCRLTMPPLYPAGGLPSLSPAYPLPLALLLPPSPPTPFPSGEGGDQGYFMQGASPLASPGLDGARHGLNLRSRHPAGGRTPPALAARPAVAVPDGGSPCLSPANPAFSLLSCPHPPAPFPSGEGGDFSFLMQGASPLASPGLGGARHWHCLWKTGSFGFKWCVGTRWGGRNPGCKKPPARAPIRRVCKCRRRFSAGVPGAKPPAK